MGSEYTLASAGGADFVRPMELLMQMVHEKWNHCVHLDAWSKRNGLDVNSIWSPIDPQSPEDALAGAGRFAQGLVFPVGPGSGNPFGIFPEQPAPFGQTVAYTLPRCSDLWRSTMWGIPQTGSLRRWDAYEDWDKGYPFGICHDLRLNYLSCLLASISGRFVYDEEPDRKAVYNHMVQSVSPRLDPDNLTLDDQLTTVDHFVGSAGTATLSTTAHRLAMPIAGQGLLSMVKMGIAETAAFARAADWDTILPSDLLSPAIGLDVTTTMRLQVCENNNGVPGSVVAIAPLIIRGWLTPVFYLHKPAVLDHTKVYWLVIDVPIIMEDAPRSYDVTLSSTEHEDTPYQLKTWNGSTWVNHAQPAFQFSLHMPKFMWRSKQIWIRADELKQQAHYTGGLHCSLRKTAGVVLPSPPAEALEQMELAMQTSTTAIKAWSLQYLNWGVENFSNSDVDYYSSAFATWPGAYIGTPSWYRPGYSEQLSNLVQQYSGNFHSWTGNVYGAQFTSLRQQVFERGLNIWQMGTARCARFEYRTGVATAAPATVFSSEEPAGVFEVDDVITLNGGLPVSNDKARLRITGVGEDGLPTGFSVDHPGRYMLTSTTQRGSIQAWTDGDRVLVLDLSMKVSEVIVVDGGSGYVSDCPVWINELRNPLGDVFQYARMRGHMSGGAIDRVDIISGGLGYGDGGIALPMDALAPPGWDDPAQSTIWPGVTYFVGSSGLSYVQLEATGYPTGYEGIGDQGTSTPVIRYNGVDYCPGQSFTGVGGVTSFSAPPDYPTWSYPMVSAGIDGWCHYAFGCGFGPKRQDWLGDGQLLVRAGGSKLRPTFTPAVENLWNSLGTMVNNEDFEGPMLGGEVEYHLDDPAEGQTLAVSSIVNGSVHFSKPEWSLNLDKESEGGGGSTGGPGTPVPRGHASITFMVDNAGYPPAIPEGRATITFGAFGEALLVATGDGEGVIEFSGEFSDGVLPGEIDATLEFGSEGEAILPGESDATLEFGSEGEAVLPGESDATIEISSEGSEAVLNGEGEGVVEFEGYGEGSDPDAPVPEGEASITFQGYGEYIETPTEPETTPDIWWPFDEASGLRIDYTGNGYDLAEQGGAVNSEAGVVDSAAIYETGPYLLRLGSIPDHSSNFTWCGWTRTTGEPLEGALTQVEVLSVQSESVAHPSTLRLLVINGTGWVVEQDPGGGSGLAENFIHPVMPTPDIWYFWTITYDQDTGAIKFYLDGDLVVSETCTNVFTATAWDCKVSVFSDGQMWRSNADAYARYPAVLTSGEVAWLYNSGSGRTFEMPDQDLETDLVGAWDFEAENGASVAGSPGPPLTGSPTYVAGKVGDFGANLVQGTSRFYSTNAAFAPTDPDEGQRSFSASLWVKQTTYGGIMGYTVSDIIKFGLDGSEAGFWNLHRMTFTSELKISSSLNSDHTILLGNYPEIGTWNHFVVTYDQTEKRMRLYVDGTLAGETTSSDPTADPTEVIVGSCKFSLGEYGGDQVVDDVRYWDREITPAQVLYLYNDGAGRPV